MVNPMIFNVVVPLRSKFQLKFELSPFGYFITFSIGNRSILALVMSLRHVSHSQRKIDCCSWKMRYHD